MKCRYHIRSLLLIVFFVLQSSLILKSQSWNFIKEQNGIKIYTRSETGSAVKGLKGEVDINASTSDVLALITNIHKICKLQGDIRDVMIYHYEKNKLIKYYLVFDTPWPLFDRDLCVEGKIDYNLATGKCTIVSKPTNLVPVDPDRVRITKYCQNWIIEPIGTGKVHLTLDAFVDPGGVIPAWLINMVMEDTPLNLLKAIRDELEH
jgi:hypothetical protein